MWLCWSVPRGSAAAFTLVELLVVLALLIVVAGVMWPEVGHLFAQHEIKQAGLSLQRQLLAARVHALRHGISYECRFDLGGRRYSIQPSSGVVKLGSLSLDHTEARQQRFADCTGTLPSGLRFGDFNEKHGNSASRQNAHNSNVHTRSSPETGWSESIVFFPDGAATQAELAIVDTHGYVLGITIERLTGAVRTTPVEKVQ